MKRLVIASLAICASARAAGLAPGADLEGPVAQPSRGRRVPGKGLDLELGADRPPATLPLPDPPRGGAAAFTFGESGRGWVARIPESEPLPSVAYGDGRVFVSGGFQSKSFYALDARDGHMLWASQELEDNGPTAPSYQDGKVIFNTESCTLFVVEARSGRKLWLRTLGDPTLAQPSVADGLVYASHPGPDGGQRLSALRLDNGRFVWTRPLDAELLAAPVVAGDAVYTASIHGRLSRYDKKSGARLWTRPLDAASAPFVAGGELHLTQRRPGRREAQIVVAAADGALLRRHRDVPAPYIGDVPRRDGDWARIWSFEGSRPIVAGGVRYEATGGTLLASDAATGEPFWSRRLAAAAPADRGRPFGAVALAASQVVVATAAGDVYGVDVDTGYTTWAYRLGRGVVAQPIVARGWVYLATTDGRVIALEVGDASLDGWPMWGGGPGHNG